MDNVGAELLYVLQNCYVIILPMVYEAILIPWIPGDDWRMCIQVLPGLVERRPGFEAIVAKVHRSTITVMLRVLLAAISGRTERLFAHGSVPQ